MFSNHWIEQSMQRMGWMHSSNSLLYITLVFIVLMFNIQYSTQQYQEIPPNYNITTIGLPFTINTVDFHVVFDMSSQELWVSDSGMIRNVNTNQTFLTGVSGMIPFEVRGDDIFYMNGSSTLVKIDRLSSQQTIIAGSPFGKQLLNCDNIDPLDCKFSARSFNITPQSEIYIANTYYNTILKFATGSNITIVAGNSVFGHFQNDDNALETSLANPNAVFAYQGDVYFTDGLSYRIGQVLTYGPYMNTIAGNGLMGKTIPGPALQTPMQSPKDIYITPQERVFFTENEYIHMITNYAVPARTLKSTRQLTGRIISTIAGGGSEVNYQNINSINAKIQTTSGLTMDGNGALYFGDSTTKSIRKLYPYCADTTRYNFDTYSHVCLCFDENGCEPPYCGDYRADNPSVCSGRGTCVSSNTCQCNQGWGGNDCSEIPCYSYTSGMSEVCSSNGMCTAVDTCTCYNGFIGKECSIPFCVGIMDKNENFVCAANSDKSIEIVSFTQVVQDFNITTLSFTKFPTKVNIPTLTVKNYLISTLGLNQTDSIKLIAASSPQATDTKGASPILSLSILKDSNNQEIKILNLPEPIEISFSGLISNKSTDEINQNFTCMYYDRISASWKSDGIETIRTISGTQSGNLISFTVQCRTKHLTSFSIIDTNYKKAIQRNNDQTVNNDSTIAAAVASTVSIVVVCGIMAAVIVAVVVLFIRFKHKKKQNSTNP